MKNSKKEWILSSVKTSKTYRQARRQQGTMKRKCYFDDEGNEISAQEWVDLALEGYISPKYNVSNSQVKGNIRRVVRRSHWTSKGFREFLFLNKHLSVDVAKENENCDPVLVIEVVE